jgi:nitrile hydratase accessory protein
MSGGERLPVSTADLPGLPLGSEGPVFAAPWQAQIFAIVVSLAERGRFPWPEFQRRLAAAIAAATAAEQGADHYYEHWLAAAEGLIAELDLVGAGELRARIVELDAARRR